MAIALKIEGEEIKPFDPDVLGKAIKGGLAQTSFSQGPLAELGEAASQGKLSSITLEDIYSKRYGEDWPKIKKGLIQRNPALGKRLSQSFVVDNQTSNPESLGAEYIQESPERIAVSKKLSPILKDVALMHEGRHAAMRETLPMPVYSAFLPVMPTKTTPRLEVSFGSVANTEELYNYAMDAVDAANKWRQKMGQKPIYPTEQKNPTQSIYDTLIEYRDALPAGSPEYKRVMTILPGIQQLLTVPEFKDIKTNVDKLSKSIGGLNDRMSKFTGSSMA